MVYFVLLFFTSHGQYVKFMNWFLCPTIIGSDTWPLYPTVPCDKLFKWLIEFK